jgi:hypothetical protein
MWSIIPAVTFSKELAMRGISVALIVAALSASTAIAGNHNNNDMGGSKTKGFECVHAIHEKHPELKGAAFKAEWGKCRNDPTAYFQNNT